MRQSVKDAFYDFSIRFEGKVEWMYLDCTSLVTSGVGNLIDPCDAALELPWVRPGGYPATATEIMVAWDKVKNTKSLAHDGYRAAEHLTDLRLTDEGIRSLVAKKLDHNWQFLCQRYTQALLEQFCADAQLGLLSMAWAAGPSFRAPLFDGYCRALDFNGAARECRFQDAENAGLRPRNDANQLLFTNAANVLEAGMDGELLYFPTIIAKQVVIEADAGQS